MIRKALIALLALGACCCFPSKSPHESDARELERKTVALVETAGGGARAYCSGVWVAEDKILTAAHCVADLEPGRDWLTYATQSDVFSEGTAERHYVVARGAQLVDRDDLHDLALLHAEPAPAHEVARVASSVNVGESVQAEGHSLGMWWSYSRGDVAALRWYDMGDGPVLHVQATAPISPGNSGGGLFNAHGDLVGICRASHRRGQNLNLWVHRNYVAAFLAGKV